MTNTSTATTTAATTTALPLAPGVWTLDAAHSRLGFTVRHLGISKVRGVFHDLATELVVGETLADTSVTATIGTASVDTGNADRDAHIRAADFIDVEVRPTMSFRSTSVEAGDDGEWLLHGELTLGDVTKPVTLTAELGGVEVFLPTGQLHAGFEAKGQIRRSDYGITFGIGEAALGDVIKLDIDLQLVAPA